MNSLRTAMLLAAWLLAAPAFAERHALLVGVSNIPRVVAAPELAGVREDIALMLELSKAWGVTTNRQQVLADSPIAMAAPTYAALIAAFNRLNRETLPGDEVLIYLSGHGTQQPVLDDDSEEDGRDEVFLLQDSEPWTESSRSIGRALVDNELRRYLEALTGRGVFIWLVVDSCHAGTLARGNSVPFRYPETEEGTIITARRLDPAQLGIKPARWIRHARSMATTVRSRLRRQLPGLTLSEAVATADMPAIIAFYAVAPGSDAFEIARKPDNKPVGLFTMMLKRAFDVESKRSGTTMRDLAEKVLTAYNHLPSTVPRPIFEGGEWEWRLNRPGIPRLSSSD